MKIHMRKVHGNIKSKMSKYQNKMRINMKANSKLGNNKDNIYEHI